MALARQSSGQLRVVWNPTERHLASLADVKTLRRRSGPSLELPIGRPEWLEALAKVTENVVEALKEGSEITHNRAERS